MSDKEAYISAHTAATMAYSLLSMHDYGKLIEAQNTADAIGPIIDPTLYRDKMKAMHEDRTIFEAANAFVRTVTAALEKARKP